MAFNKKDMEQFGFQEPHAAGVLQDKGSRAAMKILSDQIDKEKDPQQREQAKRWLTQVIVHHVIDWGMDGAQNMAEAAKEVVRYRKKLSGDPASASMVKWLDKIVKGSEKYWKRESFLKAEDVKEEAARDKEIAAQEKAEDEEFEKEYQLYVQERDKPKLKIAKEPVGEETKKEIAKTFVEAKGRKKKPESGLGFPRGLGAAEKEEEGPGGFGFQVDVK